MALLQRFMLLLLGLSCRGGRFSWVTTWVVHTVPSAGYFQTPKCSPTATAPHSEYILDLFQCSAQTSAKCLNKDPSTFNPCHKELRQSQMQKGASFWLLQSVKMPIYEYQQMLNISFFSFFFLMFIAFHMWMCILIMNLLHKSDRSNLIFDIVQTMCFGQSFINLIMVFNFPGDSPVQF